MKINIFQWRYSPFLILLPLLLPTGNAQAALSVTCEADMSTVNFGTITDTNANNASTTGTLNYSCTNNGDTSGFVSVCFAADGGQYTPSTVTTTSRYMQRINNNTTGRLRFTMMHSKSALWGTRSFGSGSELKLPSFAIGANSTITGTETINFSLTSEVNNTRARPGTYTNNFGAGNRTALTVVANTNSTLADCLQPNTPGTTRFPFTVQAAIEPSCTITATSNVDLGVRSASATTITDSNSSAITVNCTNGGSYYIGLKPSNNNINGAGVMSGLTTGNTDKVPYQLRSTAGINGTIWGNTATSTTVGNGVADFGTGSNKSHTVFVTVPSVDVRPDNYSDTVTINVNY